ncbi:MAG: acyl-CoA thioesterase [Planctomycetes bacterium]|nr:acyl-CoA thioesterase [Planctomycetota bacterium]
MKEHVVTIRPRYDEVDKMGVVHHRNYIAYFEVGRTEYMRAAGLPYTELERRGYRLVVTSLGARYRAGAGYDEELRVRTRVSGVGPASVRFEYVVERADGRVLVEGFTELACLGPNLRPARLPEDAVLLLSTGGKAGGKSGSPTSSFM